MPTGGGSGSISPVKAGAAVSGPAGRARQHEEDEGRETSFCIKKGAGTSAAQLGYTRPRTKSPQSPCK